ncbi:MAG: hypothetical protein U0354_17375 [Candidatus Sericytochromatia bacterium]
MGFITNSCVLEDEGFPIKNTPGKSKGKIISKSYILTASPLEGKTAASRIREHESKFLKNNNR